MVVSRWVLVVGWKTGRGFLGWLRGKTEGVSVGPWGDFSQFGNCSLSRKATSCFEGDTFFPTSLGMYKTETLTFIIIVLRTVARSDF
jgi:hypothetical protein